MNGATGLDTNLLVRYYIDDATDAATQVQRERARSVMESGQPLAICKTVMLELEWVLRGFYGFPANEVQRVFTHLLAQGHIHMEDRSAVERAVAGHAAGLDFADALHHASYAECTRMLTFDDRRFARRAQRLDLRPPVSLPR